MKKKLCLLLAVAMMVTGLAATVSAASFDITTIVEPQYEDADYFSDGLAAVKKDGKWGYIDEEGKMVIEPQFDYAGTFSEGVAVVGELCQETYDEGEEWEWTNYWYNLSLLSEDGSVTPLEGTEWDDGDQKTYWCSVGPEEIWDVDSLWFANSGVLNIDGTPYDTNGNIIDVKNGAQLDLNDDILYTMVGPASNGIIAMRGSGYATDAIRCFYMDVNGNITKMFPKADVNGVTTVYVPDQGLCLAEYRQVDENWNGTWYWGVLNENGSWVYQPTLSNFRFFLSGRFFSDGLLVVQNDNGMYGAIDRSGNVVIPFSYEFLSSSSEGMLAAKQNGTYFYLDTTGKRYEIGAIGGGVASQVDAAASFNGGIGPVYVDADGKAYCVQNVPKNGILTAVEGTDNLDATTYFPDYDPNTDDLGLIMTLGDIIVIQEDGKYGYAQMDFQLDLPDESAMASWAYDEVCKAIEAGLVPNELQNQYKSNITRADFALLLTEVVTTITDKDLETLVKDTTGKTLDQIAAEKPFIDATSDEILAANALGIIQGDGKGNFNPYNTITRQDAATMLLRAATAIKADAMEGWGDKIAAANVAFDDGAAFAPYAKEAIQTMAALDVMNGVGDNEFAPKATYTRQQSFVTVYRLMLQIIDEAE
jgi:hypothetical protein